jgi:hypothetical protein
MPSTEVEFARSFAVSRQVELATSIDDLSPVYRMVCSDSISGATAADDPAARNGSQSYTINRQLAVWLISLAHVLE